MDVATTGGKKLSIQEFHRKHRLNIFIVTQRKQPHKRQSNNAADYYIFPALENRYFLIQTKFKSVSDPPSSVGPIKTKLICGLDLAKLAIISISSL